MKSKTLLGVVNVQRTSGRVRKEKISVTCNQLTIAAGSSATIENKL
jgi:hypothetical protein